MQDKIILLLSQHRQPTNLSLPLALTVSQITSLLKSEIAPDQNLDTEALWQDLNELEAMGEILAGDRNRYCIAPPTLLALDENDLTSLLFTGDRTYLALVHQTLESDPIDLDNLRIRPKKQNLSWIRSCLEQIGVRLWTVADSLANLPIPQKPDRVVLRSPLTRNPFENDNWRTDQNIQQYIPRFNLPQKERWQPANYAQILTHSLSPLIRLPTGEYIWIDGTEFYEIEPDVAILAMFALDTEANANLRIIWDEPQGRLNLRGINLPSDYARCLWRISEPVNEMYRTRYFESVKRPFVRGNFKRLGCELV
ncbi:MAG: hypothetical protein HC930_03835 [Hydrococcus sp. SU_1_0]|nr:hypothetical protein [Hydrococcus sp. SU_1_0]NJO98909.1 hypothetical protein [Pleurocapsa sp. CRU_1_2]